MSSKTAQELKQIQTAVKEAFDVMYDMLTKGKTDFSRVKDLFYGDYERKRRMAATVKTAKRLKVRYAEEYSFEHINDFARYCADIQMPFPLIEKSYGTAAAAAIWLLDEIKLHGKTEELLKLLPGNYANLSHIIRDLSHSEEIIERMAYTVEHSDSETKTVFNEVLKLIPEEVRNSALRTFEESFWNIYDIYAMQMVNISWRLYELEQQIDQMTETFVSPQNFGIHSDNGLQQMYTELREIENQKIVFPMNFTLYMATKPYAAESDKAFPKNVCDRIAEFKINSPYTICAAAYMLKNDDADIFWCMGASITLLLIAAERLPWIHSEENDLTVASGAQSFDKNYHLGPDNYFLQFTNKNGGDKINAAQIIYNMTGGMLQPRYVPAFESVKTELTAQNLNEDKTDFLLNSARLLGCFASRTEDYYFEEEDYYEELFKDSEEQDNDVNDGQNDLNAAACIDLKQEKEQNKKLLSEIHTLESKIKNLREKLKETDDKYNLEHLELIDLRNIVFNLRNDINNENDEPQNPNIVFPYTAKRKIAVFGGHESWFKAIKPMLKEVKFISKDISPNPEIIKNSDTVWIQHNSISHSDYYKIINSAKTYKVRVRYFGSASARKCAEEIALDDMR